MRSAPAGRSTLVPTATILPRSNTMVPFGMSAPDSRWRVPPTKAMGRSCGEPGVGTAAKLVAAISARAAHAVRIRMALSMLAALPFVQAELARDVLGGPALGLERILAFVTRRLRHRLLHQRGAHLVLLGAHDKVLVTIEEAAPVDPRLFGEALILQWRSAPHHEVGVLAVLERAHLLL